MVFGGLFSGWFEKVGASRNISAPTASLLHLPGERENLFAAGKASAEPSGARLYPVAVRAGVWLDNKATDLSRSL